MMDPSELPRGYPRHEPDCPEDDLVLTDRLEPDNERSEYAIIYGLVCLVIAGVIGLAVVLAS